MRSLPRVCFPAGYTRRADEIPELTGELHYAIIGFLATTPSVLWLVNQEDMTKEPRPAEPAGNHCRVSELEPQNALVDQRPERSRGSPRLRVHGGHWIDTTGRAVRPL